MTIGTVLCMVMLASGPPQENLGALKEEPDISDLISYLEELSASPLDLNTASADELASIPWITSELADRIVDFRNEHGKVNSVDDLLAVKGFDPSLIAVVSEFLFVGNRDGADIFNVSGRVRATLGTGGSHSQALRLKSSFSSIVAAQIYAKGYDDKSRRVAWSANANPTTAVSIVLGDYSLGFSQGLCFDHPGMFAGSLGSKRRPIKPLGLSYGQSRMTGCAVRLSWSGLEAISAYSRKKHTARIDSDGYFVLSEGASANNEVTEEVFGERFAISPGSVKLGFSAAHILYDKVIKRSGDSEEFGFTGSTSTTFGLEAAYSTPAAMFAAEVARSSSGCFGVSASASAKRDNLKFAAIFDDLEPGFHSFHGKHTALHGVRKLRARLDRRGSQLKLFVDAATTKDLSPSYGERVPHVRQTLILSSNLKLTATLSSGLSIRISSDESDSAGISREEKRFGTELSVVLKLSPTTKLALNLERTFAESKDRRGISVRVSLGRLTFGRFSFKAGWSTYDVEDFSAAIYAYEPPVVGEHSIRLLNGSGARGYLISDLSVTDRITATAKLVTSYKDTADREISLQLAFW